MVIWIVRHERQSQRRLAKVVRRQNQPEVERDPHNQDRPNKLPIRIIERQSCRNPDKFASSRKAP